jgi:cyclomaltodextrinase
MQLESIYHRPKLNWSAAYDKETIIIRFRCKKGDLSNVALVWGDKYTWDDSHVSTEMTLVATDPMYDYWEASAKPPYRRLAYYFVVMSGRTKWYIAEKGIYDHEIVPVGMIPSGLYEYPYLNEADIIKPPSWVKEAVFYQIFPERFSNGDPTLNPPNCEPWGGQPKRDNYFGGDLQGIMDRIDYLVELGINAIYFCPVFEAMTNHKYDTKNYLKVDPQFGTNEKMKELVDLCHQKGIRVLLDAVFNHAGAGMSQFIDLKVNGAQSVYKDWFHVQSFPLKIEDGKPTYDCFAFEPHMPKLNTGHPEVRAHLLEVARYWVEEIGIDGWRLDVSNEVDHAFWRDFRRVVKQANPEAYILGEIWHDSMMWLQGDQFDAVMNYPVAFEVINFMVEACVDSQTFAERISKIQMGYPRQVNEVMFNLLDSHDTARFLTLCNENKALFRLALAFQFTYPGTPCVYYGNEVGMTGGPDPDCRKCMEWDPEQQDREIFRYFQQLITLRKNSKALQHGTFKFLSTQKGDSRFVYERKAEEEHLIILMNPYPRAREIQSLVPMGKWQDVFSFEWYKVNEGNIKLDLPAYGFAILRFQPSHSIDK